jgi:hypothetical protein
MSTVPTCVGMALGLTSQDWTTMGVSEDPAVAASADLDTTVERITSLLLIRIVAWIQPRGTFTDLSTTTICRQLLVRPESWPESVTPQVMEQLLQFVKVILSRYNDVPYHNFEHCYHVTISTNKFIDMIVGSSAGEPRAYTYGYRDDPLMQLVQVFSALIHDVEHRGVPNRQLAMEDDVLAIQYNDQSIAEMRSLNIGFSELLQSEYTGLRETLFPQDDDYRRFRTATVNLVLTTDLASPDRAQLGKSKWKEAFGDPYETVERKVLKQMERRLSLKGKKSSYLPSRRMSAQSIMSELSLDSRLMPEGDLEDDSSVSISLDNSDNEGGGAEKSDSEAAVVGGGKYVDRAGPLFRPPQTNSEDGDGEERLTLTPRSNSKIRKKSMDTTGSGDDNLNGMALKFHRRLSSIGNTNTSGASKKHRSSRLGLLRTVDLSGEELETYSNQKKVRPSATGATTDSLAALVIPPEEIDSLRETVVMEIIMKAADVAHNLQGWEQMAKWSNRLFLELKKAYVTGRGDDPQGGWFNNQIGFLEAYLLPLARKLDDTGLFGDTRGAIFAQVVVENKERWMQEGMSLTANIIREGHLQFPEAYSDEEIDE